MRLLDRIWKVDIQSVLLIPLQPAQINSLKGNIWKIKQFSLKIWCPQDTPNTHLAKRLHFVKTFTSHHVFEIKTLCHLHVVIAISIFSLLVSLLSTFNFYFFFRPSSRSMASWIKSRQKNWTCRILLHTCGWEIADHGCVGLPNNWPSIGNNPSRHD